MNLFVTKKVFNPDLGGKAIKLEGFTYDGDRMNGFYLVQSVGSDYLDLVDYMGQMERVYDGDFDSEDPNSLKLTILEEVKKE